MPINGLILPGGTGINTNPCTATQLSNNMGAIGNNLVNLQNQLGDTTNLPEVTPNNPDGTVAGALQDLQGQIDAFTAGTDKFVKVNADDTTDYLDAQFQNVNLEGAGLYSSTHDFPLTYDVVVVGADRIMLNYLDADTLTNWDATHEFAFGWSATGSPEAKTWGQVKWDSADVADYMMNQFADSGAIDTAIDPIVKFDTGTAHEAKLYVDLAAVSGYDATKVQLLTNNAGTLKWETVTSTTVVTATTFDPVGCSASVTTHNYYLFDTP